MSRIERIDIANIEEFLAHMLALKCESEDRLQDLAGCLEEHHNLEVAAIFRQLQILAAKDIDEIERLTAGNELPAIPVWEYQWHCVDSPEHACIDNAHYLMNSRQALELARFNSMRTREFLLLVMDSVPVDEVQTVARQLLQREEETFLKQIEQWLREISEEDAILCEDLDPPNIPE